MQKAIINKIPARYLHHINVEADDLMHLIITEIKEKIIPSIHKQKEEPEQEASKLEYNHSESLKDYISFDDVNRSADRS